MKAFPSSESAYERREREIARKARNCYVALAILGAVAGALSKYFQ